MKNKKTHVLSLMLLVMVTLFVGCSGSNDGLAVHDESVSNNELIVGTWFTESRSPEEMLVGRWEWLLSDEVGESYTIFTDRTFVDHVLYNSEYAHGLDDQNLEVENAGTYSTDGATLWLTATEINGEPVVNGETVIHNYRFYYGGKGLALREESYESYEREPAYYFYTSGWTPTSVKDRVIGGWEDSDGRKLTFFANGVWTSSGQNTNDPFQTIGTYTVAGERIRLANLYGEIWEYDADCGPVYFEMYTTPVYEMTLMSVSGDDPTGLQGEYTNRSAGAFELPDDSFIRQEGIDTALYGAWTMSTGSETGTLLLMENGSWLEYGGDGSSGGGIYHVEDEKFTLAGTVPQTAVNSNYIFYNYYNYGLSASGDKLMFILYGEPIVFTRTDFPDGIKLS